MTVEELARLGAEMRAAQRDYFRDRTRGALEKSKALESQFDRAVKGVIDPPKPPPMLFTWGER